MTDMLESFRDATRNFMDLYLTSASIRTNEIIRILTIVTSIFIPLTFIAGIYGMNFDPKKGPLNTVPRLRHSPLVDPYPTPYGVGYVWQSALRALIQ